MKLLGIDPGTARMGYSVIRITGKNPAVGNIKLLDTDVITTPVGMDMHKRLQLIHEHMNQVITKHRPDTMIVEKLFFNSNAKTAMTVGQARGIVMLLAAAWDMAVYEYTALEAKRLLTGYGRSTKKEMQEAVKLAFALDSIVKSDDANDAIAMVYCHLKKGLGYYENN